jgi:outer membrane protein
MNPFRIRLTALVVGAAFSGGAFAADFLDIYRLAKRNDAQFAAARASLEAGIEKLPQGRALLLPVINGAANTTHNDGENRTFDFSSRFNSNGWNVTLTQPVFRWQNLVQYQQSQFQVLQAEAQFAQATQDLIIRVGQAYFDVLAARDNIEFIKANKIAIGEQLAQAKRNFEVGTATITDTNEAQARFDLATAQEIAGINALDVAERALQQIIGQPPETLTPLRSNVLIANPMPAVMDEWAKAARASNFTVRANEAVMEIADREVGRQRAGHYPTLDVVAIAQENTNQSLAAGLSTRSTVNQNSVGLQLNLPIFAGGAVLSRTREAVALKEKARSDLEASRRAAEFNARQSYLNVTNGLAQVKALEQALVSSETALQSNRVGYEVGVRINIDVLNAQQQVFQTKRDLARARYDTILNGLRLKGAAGSLTEAEVEELNRLLGVDAPAASKPAAAAPGDDTGPVAAPIVPGGLNLSVPDAGPVPPTRASAAPTSATTTKAAPEKAASTRGKSNAGVSKEKDAPARAKAVPAVAEKKAPEPAQEPAASAAEKSTPTQPPSSAEATDQPAPAATATPVSLRSAPADGASPVLETVKLAPQTDSVQPVPPFATAEAAPAVEPPAAEAPRAAGDGYAERGLRVYQFVEPKVPAAVSAVPAPDPILAPVALRDDAAPRND